MASIYTSPVPDDVVVQVEARYALREASPSLANYSMLEPSVYMAVQELERALIRWIQSCGIAPLEDKRVLEVGCGSGFFLSTLRRIGFDPSSMVGNELLEKRAVHARRLLPACTRIIAGDAAALDLLACSFDVVAQSTMFTSILNPDYRVKLARQMWRWVAPGGGILWYDFTYDNPRNPDVKGLTLREVRQLFPAGTMRHWRITLAPPISRSVTRIHPSLYTAFNALPFLRTHLLCWISKAHDEKA
jgi:SAM-dependent methyltransferase